jgi:hypothetical protein
VGTACGVHYGSVGYGATLTKYTATLVGVSNGTTDIRTEAPPTRALPHIVHPIPDQSLEHSQSDAAKSYIPIKYQ